MPKNKKLIFFCLLVLLLSFFTTHDCLAKAFEWKDFTKPLKLNKYKLGGPNPLTINVHISAEVLRKYAKMPLIIEGDGGSYLVDLRVNNNIWAVHQLPDGGLPAGYAVKIKTKYLKPGMNKLRFTKGWNGYYTIYSLQFNIKEAEKDRAKKVMTSGPAGGLHKAL
ncbi:MAG: hypothetical protein SWH54_09160 [Thermodesulfobacteriota bacterium]|nr:hypothetical protein [Thermodesulfobacteriota bacterium]